MTAGKGEGEGKRLFNDCVYDGRGGRVVSFARVEIKKLVPLMQAVAQNGRETGL